MEWVTILREQNSILNNILIPPINHSFWTKVSKMQICDISRWHFKASQNGQPYFTNNSPTYWPDEWVPSKGRTVWWASQLVRRWLPSWYISHLQGYRWPRERVPLLQMVIRKYIWVRLNLFLRLVRGTRNSIESTREVIGSTEFLDHTDKVNNIPTAESPSQSLQQLPYKTGFFHFRLSFPRIHTKQPSAYS